MDNFEEKYLNCNTNESKPNANNQQNIKQANNNLYFTLKNEDAETEFNKPRKSSHKYLIPAPKECNFTDSNKKYDNLDAESKYLEERYISQNTLNYEAQELHDKDFDNIISKPSVYVKKPSNKFLIPVLDQNNTSNIVVKESRKPTNRYNENNNNHQKVDTFNTTKMNNKNTINLDYLEKNEKRPVLIGAQNYKSIKNQVLYFILNK